MEGFYLSDITDIRNNDLITKLKKEEAEIKKQIANQEKII